MLAPQPKITRDDPISAETATPPAAAHHPSIITTLPQLLREFAEHFPRGEVPERASLRSSSLSADKRASTPSCEGSPRSLSGGTAFYSLAVSRYKKEGWREGHRVRAKIAMMRAKGGRVPKM